mgnify:CR=1 FL=1
MPNPFATSVTAKKTGYKSATVTTKATKKVKAKK